MALGESFTLPSLLGSNLPICFFLWFFVFFGFFLFFFFFCFLFSRGPWGFPGRNQI